MSELKFEPRSQVSLIPKPVFKHIFFCIMSILKADEKLDGVPDHAVSVCVCLSCWLREILGLKSSRYFDGKNEGLLSQKNNS